MRSMMTATEALCAQTDPEMFFAQDSLLVHGKASYPNARAAKALCAKCPLALSCLMTAIDNEEQFGIWGGTMPKERRYIKTRAQAVVVIEKLRERYGEMKPLKRYRK